VVLYIVILTLAKMSKHSEENFAIIDKKSHDS